MNIKNVTIGLFDSGSGVLPVVASLNELINKFDLSEVVKVKYFMDSANFPYGTKTHIQLKSIVENNINMLIGNGCDIVGIACNTASVVYNENQGISLNNIVPVINISSELAAKKSKKHVHVISTNFTAQSHAYKDLLTLYNPKLTVTESGEQLLVKAIENNDNLTTYKELNRIINSLPNSVDTLVLGCTHFSRSTNLVNKILNELQKEISIIDPAEEMSVRLILQAKALLDNANFKISQNTTKYMFQSQISRKDNLYE